MPPSAEAGGRTSHSRSTFRDASARLQVCLRRLRFGADGDTESRYASPRCSHVVLIPAPEAFEILADAVVFMSTATRRTAFGRVVRWNLHGFHAVCFRLVLVLKQPAECPDVLPRRLWHVFADVR